MRSKGRKEEAFRLAKIAMSFFKVDVNSGEQGTERSRIMVRGLKRFFLDENFEYDLKAVDWEIQHLRLNLE